MSRTWNKWATLLAIGSIALGGAWWAGLGRPVPGAAKGPTIAQRRGEARVLARGGDLARAAELLKGLVVEAPDDPQVWGEYAAVLLAQGNEVEALRAAQRLAEFPETAARGEFLMGFMYHRTYQYAQALGPFAKALALDEDLKTIGVAPEVFWESYGVCLLVAGRAEEAASILDKAQHRWPSSALLVRLGRAHHQSGNEDRAREAWTQARNLDPDRAEAWLELGRQALRRGDPAGAVTLLQHAEARAPESYEPPYVLSQAHRRLGETEKAKAAEERAKRNRREPPSG